MQTKHGKNVGAHVRRVLVHRSVAVDSEEPHRRHRTAMTGTDLRRHAETATLYTAYTPHNIRILINQLISHNLPVK